MVDDFSISNYLLEKMIDSAAKTAAKKTKFLKSSDGLFIVSSALNSSKPIVWYQVEIYGPDLFAIHWRRYSSDKTGMVTMHSRYYKDICKTFEQIEEDKL